MYTYTVSCTQATTLQWLRSVDILLWFILSQLLDRTSSGIFGSQTLLLTVQLERFLYSFFELRSFSPCIKKAGTEREKSLHGVQLQPAKISRPLVATCRAAIASEISASFAIAGHFFAKNSMTGLQSRFLATTFCLCSFGGRGRVQLQ